MGSKTYAFDQKLIAWLSKVFPPLARVAIFVVFFWFGLLKLLGLSPAGPLAHALVTNTVGPAYFNELYLILAALECLIGVLFLIPRATRLTIPLLLGHMVIVSSPLILVPSLAWSQVFVPTLEGQYIIKNIAIIALAIGIAAQLRPLGTR